MEGKGIRLDEVLAACLTSLAEVVDKKGFLRVEGLFISFL